MGLDFSKSATTAMPATADLPGTKEEIVVVDSMISLQTDSR